MSPRAIPDGFQPLEPLGPFLKLFGPVYIKRAPGSPVLGLRVEEKHLNTRGIAHGGMLVALADCALSVNLSAFEDPPRPMVTVSLSTDFLQPGRNGDWIEAHVQVQKGGIRLAFASCQLLVGERCILRASGVFALAAGAGAPPGKAGVDG